MTERSAQTYSDQVRDTVVKSSLTGVAATVLAVTIFSPAGFGGMIGISLASGFGGANDTAATDAYSVLPAYPAPLSGEELNAIQTQLAQTSVSLEITRAATDARVEQLRSMADGGELVTFEPVQTASVQPQREDLRLSLTEPVAAIAPLPAAVQATPISYGGSTVDMSAPYRDPHLELAELFLAHESF